MSIEVDVSDFSADFPPEVAKKLEQLTPGTYCKHRSWGFGRIKAFTPEGMIVIDFDGKTGHNMQAEYATESLVPLPPEHILVHISEHLDQLQQRCEDEPLDVVRQVITSLGNTATAQNITETLCPAVIEEDKWRKWWDGAKRAMRKDGHFFLPTKKSEALRILDAPSDLADQAVADFKACKTSKKQIAGLQQVIKFWPDIKDPAVANKLVKVTNDMIVAIPASKLEERIDLAIVRDNLIEEAGAESVTGDLSLQNLSPKEPRDLSDLLEQLASVKQVKLLNALGKARQDWDDLFLKLLPTANGRTADTIINAFVEAGREDEIKSAVDRLLRERNVTCDFLYWFCKNRQDLFADLYEPPLMMAVLSVLEADHLADYRKGTRLYELLIGDKELVAALLEGAAFEDVRDVTRAILLSPVFEELDKRSFLAKIIKLFPEVQAMIVSGEDKKNSTPKPLGIGKLVVSWPSLRARSAELDEIKNKKIPANIKEIEVALSYGDLRENAEFKAAKETQRVLNRRREELEDMLSRAEGTDFSKVSTTEVNVGTEVTIKSKETGETEVYNIFGAWDSDPKRGIISYLTPLASSLISHKVGEEVEIPGSESGKRMVTIEKIETADAKALIGE